MSKALTPEERTWIEQLASLGPSILFEKGMSEVEAQAFMDRPEVKAHLERFAMEVQQQDVLGALTRFSAKRQLARLVPDSVEVLRRALVGPMYAFETVFDSQGNEGIRVRRTVGKDTPQIDIPEPTSNQLRAAAEVLDRVGVQGAAKLEGRVSTAAVSEIMQREQVIDTSFAVNPETDSYEQQTLSRERVRNVLEILKSRIPQLMEGEPAKALVKSLSPKSVKVKRPKAASAKKVKAPTKPRKRTSGTKSKAKRSA